MNSTQTARAIVSQLVAAGVGHVVVCPGSRSGPLALAVAQAEEAGLLRAHVRLDERGAAFFALGLAKALLLPRGSEPKGSAADSQHADGAGQWVAGGPARAVGKATSEAPGGVAAAPARGGDTPAFGPLVAVLVTSGTAVANLHPAVLEARHGRVPLIVVTADRPHEIRGVGASQTTDQVRMFGEAVRYFAEIPANGPVGSVVRRAAAASIGNWRVPARCLQWTETIWREKRCDYREVDLTEVDWADRAAWGPVHLNVAFSDPLLPTEPFAPGGQEAGAGMSAAGVPLPVQVEAVPNPLTVGEGTVVLAGDGGLGAGTFAQTAYLPLLAEPSSGLRTHPLAIGPYRELLETELGRAITKVVVFGHPTLSRPVSALLARRDVEVVVVDDGPEWTDVAANADLVLPAAWPMPVEEEHQIPHSNLGRYHAAWTVSWVLSGRSAQQSLHRLLAAEESLSSWRACDLVWQHHRADWRAGQGAALVIGASAAIRHFDLLAGAEPPALQYGPTAGEDGEWHGGEAGVEPEIGALPTGDGPFGGWLLAKSPEDEYGERLAAGNVISNRGLAGIDGTIATAAGVAARTGGPVRCVVGDLTFLHDAGSLLRGVLEAEVDLDVIVLNDAGGAIFATLEAGDGRTGEYFERFWGTPQDVDIKALAAAYRCGYVRAENAEQLSQALQRIPQGRRVIEVRCAGQDSRLAGLEMRRRVRERAAL